MEFANCRFSCGSVSKPGSAQGGSRLGTNAIIICVSTFVVVDDTFYERDVVLALLSSVRGTIGNCIIPFNYVEAHNNLANVLLKLGRTNEAIEHYRQALALWSSNPLAHTQLAGALLAAGRLPEAIEHYNQALPLQPNDTANRFKLANALIAVGRTDEAIGHYNQLLQLMPNSSEVANNLAWLLATREPVQGSDPARAVQLAERARELAGRESAECLDTLSVAYAAAGRFADATATAQRAISFAELAGQASLAKEIGGRLELYRAGRAYRESSHSATQAKPEK